MRLILSRKGFDSAAGGGPSPILPDGTLLSLPIPERSGTRRYSEIESPAGALSSVLSQLYGPSRGRPQRAHLDPDLTRDSCSRRRGWVPAFGQDSAAAAHLDSQGVGVGDLFVFFGWFRRTEWIGSRLRFVRGAPDIHACFGWLFVDRVLKAPDRGLQDHPHFRNKRLYAENSRVYAADSPRGAGVFPRFGPELQLTCSKSAKRSEWELPAFFHPRGQRTPLTYHASAARSPIGSRCLLRSVGRGQEFVLKLSEYPEALGWARGLGVAPSPSGARPNTDENLDSRDANKS